MGVGLYIDVNVPAAMSQGLRHRGIDVLTSQEDGTRSWADEALLDRATQLNRILVTQDGDFLEIASHWQSCGRDFAGVVYSHQRSAGIGRIVDDLELLATCADQHELLNRVTYLPLR